MVVQGKSKKIFNQFVLCILLISYISACTTKKKIVSDDEMSTEMTMEDGAATDDLALGTEGSDSVEDSKPQSAAADSDELSLEGELNEVAKNSGAVAKNTEKPQSDNPMDEAVPAKQNTAASDELSLDEPQAQTAKEDTTPSPEPTTPAPVDPNLAQPEAVAQTPVDPAPTDVVPPVTQEATPAPVAEQKTDTPPPTEVAQAQQEPPAAQKPELSEITSLQFKANDNGGAFLINGNQPLQYTTRLNSNTNQVVIEVQNVKIASKLKRPLLTKDMKSSIGSIDIYQNKGSNIARFVIQLRPQSSEPLIQPEGNSLVVIGAPVESAEAPAKVAATEKPKTEQAVTAEGEEPTAIVSNKPIVENSDVNVDLSQLGILNTKDLEDYLANNHKFYGKKISIEANDIDIKYVLNLISEESGINLILDNDINGRISVKLRKVPWDQALVLVLKSAKLTYRRQGSVLRVLTLDSLVKEDKMALELQSSKEKTEPLVVKNFAINYADIGELEKKIKELLADTVATERTNAGLTGLAPGSASAGKVVSDKRTGMLIVTATATRLKQIEAMIKVLDMQPHQVMVEARVIEAGEAFNKSMGVNWGLNRGVATGSSRITSPIGNPWSDPEPINISPSISYTSPKSLTGSFGTSLWLGKLGVFGDLDAQLRLDESEDRIKILSSPRVTVVSNTQASINQSFKLKVGTETTITNGISVITDKFADVGVKLNVTPQISNIGTVRMMIDVARTGAQPDNTSTNSRDMKTEVIVKTGQTVVIGGVFQSDVLKNKGGIPGLQDIPILGTLFRGSSEQSSKTELMVFVTPKVLSPLEPATLSLNQASPSGSPTEAPKTDLEQELK